MDSGMSNLLTHILLCLFKYEIRCTALCLLAHWLVRHSPRKNANAAKTTQSKLKLHFMKSDGNWKNTENIGVCVKIMSHIFSRDESSWTGIERRGGYIYKIFPGLIILT